MKNIIKNITRLKHVWIFVPWVALNSCSDFLDRVPQDEIVDETYWKTQEQLEMAVTGIYSRVKAKNIIDMENMGENTMWPTTTEYKDIGSGVFPVTQPTVDNEWRNMYRDIRECNVFLENYKRAQETVPGANERLAAIPQKSNRKGIGEVDITLYFGGVTINSGDYIYADNNGIVIAKEKLVDC